MNRTKLIAGVDEVGRGSLVGSVFSSAVILEDNHDIDDLRDSKAISPTKRFKIAQKIIKNALSVSIGIATLDEIDKLNTHHATLLSMKRAIDNLCLKPCKVYIDGKYKPDIEVDTESIIKGDQKIKEISAASIIAKVARDNEMLYIDSKIDQYDIRNNKGYGTYKHMNALSVLGKSIYHRKSFLK